MAQQMADLSVCGIVVIAIIIMMVMHMAFMMSCVAHNHGGVCQFAVTVNHLPGKTRRHEGADQHDKQQPQDICRDVLHSVRHSLIYSGCQWHHFVPQQRGMADADT